MMDYEVKVERKIKLTQQDIDDIVCVALDGGITCWCREAEVVGGEYLGEWAHEQISRGGELRLYDAETEDSWVLTKDNLLYGFKMWAENEPDEYGVITGDEIDTCAVDGGVADSIVQYALFGEIVFG